MIDNTHHTLHHKREVKFLLVLMIIFVIIFFVALLDIKRNVAIMGVLPARAEDIMIMVFSCAAIIKVVWHLIK